jgi:hypothetical protein
MQLSELTEVDTLLECIGRPSVMAENMVRNCPGVLKTMQFLVEQAAKHQIYDGLAMTCFKLGLHLGYQQAQLERLGQ